MHAIRFALILALLAAILPAQAYFVLENGTGKAGSVYTPTAGHPYGADSVRGAMTLQEFAGLPPATISNPAAPVGGMASDQDRGVMYSCNGFTVQVESHSEYATPVIATSVGLAVWMPSNTITGMAHDSSRQILYCVDDKFLQGFNTNPAAAGGMWSPVNANPIWLGFLNAGDNLSGLGWESSASDGAAPVPTHGLAGSGNLWACATNGKIYQFDSTGQTVASNANPTGTQPVTTVASTGIIAGLAVNTTNGGGPLGLNGYNNPETGAPNSASWVAPAAPWVTRSNGSVPAPVCSFQQAGYHICVTDGANIYDVFPNAGGPIAVGNGNGSCLGMAFSTDAQLLPGGSPCPLSSSGTAPGGTGTNPGTGTPPTGSGPTAIIRTSAAQTFNRANISVDMNSGPVNTPARLMLDICPIPGANYAAFGGLALPTGDTMHIWPLSANYNGALVAPTNGFGTLQTVVPNGAVVVMSAGFQFSFQYHFVDSANQTLYGCFTDGVTMTWGLH